MKKNFLVFALCFISIPALATTWRVDPVNGGPRHSSSSTGVKADCTGKGNTPFNRSGGQNQACPFASGQDLWNDSWVYQNASWLMVAGDTVIFDNCTATTPCVISGSTDASAPGKHCFGLSNGCTSPTLPNGTSGAHIVFEGHNAGSCSTTKTYIGAAWPQNVGDPTKEDWLVGIGTSIGIFETQTTQYVDFVCLNLSDESQCGAEIDCHSDAGSSNYAFFSGYFAGGKTSTNGNLAWTDITIHGMGAQGFKGACGGLWTFDRVSVEFVGQTGLDLDDGQGTAISNCSIVQNDFSVFAAGCPELYPVPSPGTNPFPAVTNGCASQSSSPISITADGVGTPVTAGITSWTSNRCLAAYNTQDGNDLGHMTKGAVSWNRCQMYGNMGGAYKVGPNNTVSVTASFGNANCQRMISPIPASNSGYSQKALIDFCRAGGDQNGFNPLTTAVADPGFGSFTTTGTAVVGSRTKFTQYFTANSSSLTPKDQPASTYTRLVTVVTDDTHMTLASAFPANISGELPISIPAGGAKSSSVITAEGNTFVGYGGSVFDMQCQTGAPDQQQVDGSLCGGKQIIFKNNIVMGYSESSYNAGQTPGLFPDLQPTTEDYNNFFNLRSVQRSGAHDITTTPNFVSQPANPIIAESQLDNFNFTLTSASRAKAAGIPIGGLTIDFAGNAFNSSTPSIGALQFGATPTVATPSARTDSRTARSQYDALSP